MKRLEKGFGLVEVMLALVLGLVMSLALAQIFISSKSSYASQTSSASLQEDARFVLSKMVQEVQLVGMFGCLGKVDDASVGTGFSKAFEDPIHWDASSQTLSLAKAGTGEGGGWSTWVIHTDCVSSATAWLACTRWLYCALSCARMPVLRARISSIWSALSTMASVGTAARTVAERGAFIISAISPT